MNNTIEFVLRMRDMMSSNISKVSATSQSAFSKMSQSANQVTEKNKILGVSYDDLTKKIAASENALKNSRLSSGAPKVEPSAGGGAISSVGGKLAGGLGMLGVGFAAFKGLELIHEGIEALEKLHQAQAQVKAGLESTGYAAGITAKELDDMAKGFSQNTKYSRADVTDLQSLILTFPSITKATFPEATKAILDMSTRLGQDTKSSAIQLGKALQDPISGITALKRVGVNFSDSQKDVIEKLVETGKKAEAQKLILKELATEFGGSAAAAFNADPLAKYNKMMASMKMATGEAGMMVLETIQPALLVFAQGVKWTADEIKNLIHWTEEHKELVESVAVFVGILSSAYFINIARLKLLEFWQGTVIASNIVQTFSTAALAVGMEGASMAGMTLAGVMAVLNSVNPFVWVAAGIAALVLCYKKFDGFRALVDGVWASIKQVGTNLIGMFTSIPDMIIKAFTQIPKAIANVFSGVGDLFSAIFSGNFSKVPGILKSLGSNLLKTNPVTGFAQQVFTKATEGVGDAYSKAHSKSLLDSKNAKKKKGESALDAHNKLAATNTESSEKAGDTVSGAGPKIINIHVGKFFDNLSFTTLNSSETAQQMEDIVMECFARVVYNGSKMI